MSESLRNDGRVWVPKNAGDKRSASDIPDADRDYYLERRYPSFGNLVPRDVASRASKERCDSGYGVGESGLAVFLDFRDAIKRDGEDVIRKKYGNLFHMYEKITAENPYQMPMRIYPAVHYTMGGLWVDYNLMSNIPGLYVLGEANFSDHGANRLGASALMRVADFMEFGELLAMDALYREESCGGHFREEHQTPDGEAKRNDAEFSYVAAWESHGVGNEPTLHKEPLTFENVLPSTRSYK
jgi:succinate dehydrogenase/fumarate reductase flavoprotein subunit